MTCVDIWQEAYCPNDPIHDFDLEGADMICAGEATSKCHWCGEPHRAEDLDIQTCVKHGGDIDDIVFYGLPANREHLDMLIADHWRAISDQ